MIFNTYYSVFGMFYLSLSKESRVCVSATPSFWNYPQTSIIKVFVLYRRLFKENVASFTYIFLIQICKFSQYTKFRRNPRNLSLQNLFTAFWMPWIIMENTSIENRFLQSFYKTLALIMQNQKQISLWKASHTRLNIYKYLPS